jgi:Zn-dependent M28 family amino/carboxypeptidase
MENLDPAELSRRLRHHVTVLCDEIGPRSIYTIESLRRAEDYISRAMGESGYEIERQVFCWHTLELANLIARPPGYSPQGQQYILCAHYDTVSGTPGADDNASAVAVLLEVARMAREQGLVCGLGLNWQFIAFTAEEPPTFHTRLQGSRVFARQARRRKLRIDGVINLEMVGCFSNAPKSQSLPFPLQFFGYPRTGDFIAVVGNWKSRHWTRRVVAGMKENTRLPVESVIVPERGFLLFLVRLSDHSSFWDHGYPAVMVTDTAFLRNPRYHTRRDTPDTLNYDAMAEVTRSILLFMTMSQSTGA